MNEWFISLNKTKESSLYLNDSLMMLYVIITLELNISSSIFLGMKDKIILTTFNTQFVPRWLVEKLQGLHRPTHADKATNPIVYKTKSQSQIFTN